MRFLNENIININEGILKYTFIFLYALFVLSFFVECYNYGWNNRFIGNSFWYNIRQSYH